MKLATVNDDTPCQRQRLSSKIRSDSDRQKWRRRESNTQGHSRNSEVAKRLWNMLQDVGVSRK